MFNINNLGGEEVSCKLAGAEEEPVPEFSCWDCTSELVDPLVVQCPEHSRLIPLDDSLVFEGIQVAEEEDTKEEEDTLKKEVCFSKLDFYFCGLGPAV